MGGPASAGPASTGPESFEEASGSPASVCDFECFPEQARLVAIAVFLRGFSASDEADVLGRWERVSFRIYGFTGEDKRLKVGDYTELAWSIINDKLSPSEIKKRLSEIGKEITASLDLNTILFKLYERVNQIVDASIFGVGLYRPEKHLIEYSLAIENGKRYAPYTRSTDDKNQFAVWCIDHRQPILLNDVDAESSARS